MFQTIKCGFQVKFDAAQQSGYVSITKHGALAFMGNKEGSP